MFQIGYILNGSGWATASVSDGDASIDMNVSYLSDGLGDFARAARGTLRGMNETTFNFEQEPGEHRFIVTREGGNVQVEIYRFADTFSRSRAGELVMVARCTLREFANTCINCLRHVLDEHGEAGYRQMWKSHDFPIREYRDLLSLRRELPSVEDEVSSG